MNTTSHTWLETQWQAMYKDRNPLIVTTAFAFTYHEMVYFGRYLPFLICDYIPSLQKYKIQQNKQNSPDLLKKCITYLLYSQFCIQLPMQMLFHPTAEFFGMKIESVPLPSWSTIAYQVLLFMIFEDFYHYWMHRFLHWGPLYKNIHKIHHEFSAPFGMAAEYAHPLETLILGLGTIGGPLLYVACTGDLHIFTVYMWILVRLFQTVDAHSGYDFPWSLRRWMPFWGGSDFHDHHHAVFLGNYATSFRIWDWVFGTDKRYNAWVQRQKEQASKLNAVNAKCDASSPRKNGTKAFNGTLSDVQQESDAYKEE